jgi:hypothetical protein
VDPASAAVVDLHFPAYRVRLRRKDSDELRGVGTADATGERALIATMSQGLYALLVTGGCFALVALVLLIQELRPARLRSWRDQRQVKRSVIAELERRQEELLDRMRDTNGDGHSQAFASYLELQNSIEAAKRM